MDSNMTDVSVRVSPHDEQDHDQIFVGRFSQRNKKKSCVCSRGCHDLLPIKLFTGVHLDTPVQKQVSHLNILSVQNLPDFLLNFDLKGRKKG